jgi:hypothetical protein
MSSVAAWIASSAGAVALVAALLAVLISLLPHEREPSGVGAAHVNAAQSG